MKTDTNPFEQTQARPARQARAAVVDAAPPDIGDQDISTLPLACTPADPTPVPAAGSDGKRDLSDPNYYLNRELTWLNFNFRVLHEAEDDRTPLLERLRFIAIVSSNVDEFFMKRIGGLKQQVGAGIQERTVDGRTPERQIVECYALVKVLEQRKRDALLRVLGELNPHGIEIVTFESLDADAQRYIRDFYLENIFPLLTPQSTDPAHPFPFISNLSLNLLVTLHYPEDPASTSVARVKVPIGSDVPRFLQLPDREAFVPLESVIANNLDLLFPGMEIDSCEQFRVTRNANTDIDEEEADDLLELIETGLRKRRFAPIVRMEVGSEMRALHRGMLGSNFGLQDPADIFEVDGMLAMGDLVQLADLKRPELRYPAHHPVDHPLMITDPDRSVFHIIRDAGSILVHHPYESFATSVERFLKEASEDPKVRAIKMTLYRTARDSKVIRYLRNAVRNGKQVAVVLELKARFDEAANIRWANQLEETGVHVTYGVMGLKTHCKAILVVRQDYNRLRRYAHVGTGNYHADTARQYSDLGLLTCDDTIGHDLTELFNYLTTGYKPKRNYRSLLPAPKALKQALLDKIARELSQHSSKNPGLIQLKINALDDAAVTAALYEAARGGVQVQLIVRDTCRLRPGIPGLSENVTVLSIVGRFLEHSRIFHFRNGGQDEYYIGSADCMQRNLDSRVEVLVPVVDLALQRDLQFVLDSCLEDRRQAWEMRADGSYLQRVPKSRGAVKGLQQTLIEWAEKREKEASRLKRRKVRGVHVSQL